MFLKEPDRLSGRVTVSSAPPLQGKMSDESSCRQYNTGITILFATIEERNEEAEASLEPPPLISGKSPFYTYNSYTTKFILLLLKIVLGINIYSI